MALDNSIRRYIDPPVERFAAGLARRGANADAVTLLGFGLGVVAAGAIALQWYLVGLALILVSRLCDGLDGAVARATGGATDRGGYLDIVLDFAFYGLVPLGFVLADPSTNGVAGAVLLAAFYVNGASFLAFALMEEKRGTTDAARGRKSFIYSIGLMEATETLATFVLACLFPSWFPDIAYAAAGLTVLTTLARIGEAWGTFGSRRAP